MTSREVRGRVTQSAQEAQVIGRRYGLPAQRFGAQTGQMTRLLALLIALTLTAGCSYIQMQPKSGGQPTPYAPRLP